MKLDDIYTNVDYIICRTRDNYKRVAELLKDEKVCEFFKLINENKQNSLMVKWTMENCSHVFVKTKVVEDGNHIGGIAICHCLKCGMTNEYSVKNRNNELTEIEREITDIYSRTYLNGCIISEEICKLETARTVYEWIKRENLSISDAELQGMFPKVYSRYAKTVREASLFHQPEQRSEDNGTSKVKK